MEHYRPDGTLAQGYFCTNCGQSCSMYGSGHRDKDFNPICTPNPTLVQQLKNANSTIKSTFVMPAVIRDDD